jgi:hypothetical protein
MVKLESAQVFFYTKNVFAGLTTNIKTSFY